MKHFFRTLGLLALLCAGGAIALAQGTSGPPAEQPDTTVAAFYKWYLHEMSLNHTPVTDNSKKLGIYASAALLREINRRMNSPNGMDADYFIQAQDYLDDWLDNIQTSDTKVQVASATTVVTLGKKPDNIYRLAVGLVRETGTWKIRSVRRLPSPAAR
jgi:Protein of unknown function (DUF3828)